MNIKKCTNKQVSHLYYNINILYYTYNLLDHLLAIFK